MASARTTIVGVFANRSNAERAVAELERLGFREEQIGFLTRDGGDGGTADPDQHGGHPGHVSADDAGAGERAAKGAGVGIGVGGILAAVLALAIPGIGPAVAGGILATTVTGAAVGGVAGGIAGALTSLDVPDEEARYYDAEFQAGRTLVTVRTETRNSDPGGAAASRGNRH
jgi:hypothetical protein